MSRRNLLTALTIAALAVGGSVVFASPAFASPTPATGPVATISNVAFQIVQDSSGRQVGIQYNYSVADPSLPADSIVEVTTYNSCDTPTVTDQDVPLPNAQNAGISLFVTVPAQGYVEVQVYSSNGTAAPLVTAPVYGTDQANISSNVGASFTPNSPPTTGIYSINSGNAIPVVHYQLYANGAPTGSILSIPGCGQASADYSAAAGTTLTLHVLEGDLDVATTTVPGGDPAAVTQPPITRLPITGVSPGSWYAGGAGLAALLLGVVLLLLQVLGRRRRTTMLP